jgi:hypothetical protein
VAAVLVALAQQLTAELPDARAFLLSAKHQRFRSTQLKS